jgi:ribonuclease VapC
VVIIDSSALLAIVLDEPEREAFLAKISGDPKPLIASANYVEAAIVLMARRGPAAVSVLGTLLKEAGIAIAQIDEAISDGAIDAFRRFGKGRHPAGLNFGDCFAYALASATGEPLLFKGDDFAKTDIAAA